MSRVPSGQLERSTSSVSSTTAAPSRSSPFCLIAWCQSSSNPNVSKIALCIWRFERHTTENPTFLCRQAATKSSVQPAESARITTLRWTRDCLLYTSDAADDLLCVDLGG